ncbi:hypothetical protein ACJ73_06218 [Blastomyces percursus]|uniref:Uncharacterized protein n=1 Tax=Blastomyces percursus TaxID=1658174 RepID=A0A1J9R336_9EURO|nr:hypothetical protein ACJ73_06218 [Blastomyces percursus]
MTISSASHRYDKPKAFSPCLLLLLPYELRHQIYNASLTASHPIDPHNKRQTSFSPSLLATCKQIHDEATPVLYRENEFILRNILRDTQWLDEIGGRNASILKRVQFFVDEGPIIMTEFGGVVNDGHEQRLRALLRRLTRDAKGLRYLRVHLAGLGEKDYECYKYDEEGYGMQPRWGWGEDRQFMLELGRMCGLTELVIDGAFETTWMGYLRKQMGDEVKVLHNMYVNGDGSE